MGLLTDDQREKLKQSGVRAPIVDETCIGCGSCVAICGNAYDLDDDGMSIVQELDNYEGIGIEDTILVCPTNSIKWK